MYVEWKSERPRFLDWGWRQGISFSGSHHVLVSILTCLAAMTLMPNGAHAQATAPQVHQTQEFVEGEVIVKLKGKANSTASRAFIGRAVTDRAMTLKGSWGGLNLHHFQLSAGKSVDAALSELRADANVEYAEPNYLVHTQSIGAPTDVISYDQAVRQARANAGRALSSGTGDVHAESSNQFASNAMIQTDAPIQLNASWDGQSTSRAPVVVAVIDTGIDFTHTVFTQTGAIWTNPREISGNGVDDDGNGFIDDVHGWNFVASNNSPQDDAGHGTHVSGIILGVSQNIFASSLTTAAISIMPLKFLDSTGSGSTADAVQAIYYAANNGAQVMNNSWGGGDFSNSLLDAIAYAYQKKIVFVAAAGNASTDNDSNPTYPANYNVPNVISVAATSDQDDLAGFSNFGAQTVHMGSPGVSVYSTLPNQSIGRESGTSMSTPFVTGIAALMVREQPSMSSYQIRSLILAGGDAVTSLQTTTTNKVRLDLANSLTAAKSAIADSSQPAYNVSANERNVASSGGGGCGLVGKAAWDSRDGDQGGDMSGPVGPNRSLAFFAMLILLAAPIAVSVALRSREGASRRKHTRYQIDSQVRVKFGDRELVGQVSSISMGGVQLNTEAWLENGGIVKMAIQSPDGKEEIQIDGKVVWSEEKKRYGVAFDHAEDSALSTIRQWTQELLKAA